MTHATVRSTADPVPRAGHAHADGALHPFASARMLEDHVYQGASLGTPPLTGVQTVSVPPGGATVVDFKIDRARRYTLVDHALSRVERGLVGFPDCRWPIE